MTQYPIQSMQSTVATSTSPRERLDQELVTHIESRDPIKNIPASVNLSPNTRSLLEHWVTIEKNTFLKVRIKEIINLIPKPSTVLARPQETAQRRSFTQVTTRAFRNATPPAQIKNWADEEVEEEPVQQQPDPRSWAQVLFPGRERAHQSTQNLSGNVFKAFNDVINLLKKGNKNYEIMLGMVKLEDWISNEDDEKNHLLTQIIRILHKLPELASIKIKCFVLYILEQLKAHPGLIQSNSPLWNKNKCDEDIIAVTILRGIWNISMELLALRKLGDPDRFKAYLETPQKHSLLIQKVWQTKSFQVIPTKHRNHAVIDRQQLQRTLAQLYDEEGVLKNLNSHQEVVADDYVNPPPYQPEWFAYQDDNGHVVYIKNGFPMLWFFDGDKLNDRFQGLQYYYLFDPVIGFYYIKHGIMHTLKPYED